MTSFYYHHEAIAHNDEEMKIYVGTQSVLFLSILGAFILPNTGQFHRNGNFVTGHVSIHTMDILIEALRSLGGIQNESAFKETVVNKAQDNIQALLDISLATDQKIKGVLNDLGMTNRPPNFESQIEGGILEEGQEVLIDLSRIGFQV